MKVQLVQGNQAGVAHLGIVIAAVVIIVAALGVTGYAAFTKKDTEAKQADARGAYSSICKKKDPKHRSYNLRNSKKGNGFTVYNYKNKASGRGCALAVNGEWGKRRWLGVLATKSRSYIKGSGCVMGGIGAEAKTYASDSGKLKYYAGPIFYKHKVGTWIGASKSYSSGKVCFAQYKITAN